VVDALFRTTTIEWRGQEHLERFRRAGAPVIFAFWHGSLLPLVHVHRGQGIVVLVSRHGDGEIIARIIERKGFRTVRGSSSRGGMSGLRGLVREARRGHDLAVTPDGPRGPRAVFKEGALVAAQMTGLPIVPIAVSASPAWRLSSWDGFLIPKPGSTVTVEYLEPRFVDREASRNDLEVLAARLGEDLVRAERGRTP
jgi:lysophospholipid acyltransferase (LPLAT)-like uncharacterized protein